MGFLTCNRSKRKLLARGARNVKRVHCDEVLPVEKRAPANLENLPAEILEVIFVQSANFALPQTSLTLARKLRRTKVLEEYMLLGQREESNQTPVQILGWPFITRQLLERLQIQFNSKHIPKALHMDSPKSLDLIIYLIEKGSIPDDPESLYNKLLESGRSDDIRTLLHYNIPCDQHVAVNAMKLGYLELAQELVVEVVKTSSNISETEEIWTFASQIQNTSILECLNELKFQGQLNS